MAANKITLAHKKNLRDFEPKRIEYLNKIKDLTGIEFEFSAEPSLEAYLSDVIDHSSEHQVCGQALYGDEGYLHHVLKFFEKQWGDELVRDAIKEATKNKKLVIRNNRVENEIAFENGTMYLNIPAYNFNLYKKYVSDFDPSRIL